MLISIKFAQEERSQTRLWYHGKMKKKGEKPPLTNAERHKRLRAKQNEINPEGYKLKIKRANKK